MRMNNRGVLPALLIPAILLIFGASAVMLSWMFFAEMLMATLIMIFGFVLLYMGYLAMQANQQKMFAGLIVTAMICMGISVYVSPIKLTQLAPADFSTETDWKTKDWRGVHFKVLYMDKTELADSYQYITSWKPDGNGETVIAQACWQLDPLSASQVLGWKYEFYYTEGASWGEPERTHEGAGSVSWMGYICAEVFTETPRGVLDGYIRIVFHALLSDPLECQWGGCWKRVVIDDAHYRSGRGWIDGFEKNPVQIGDEVKVRVSVGYASSSKEDETGMPEGDGGWSLELFSVTQGKTVKVVSSADIPEGQTTTVSTGYIITDVDFDNNPATCMGKNQIIVTLFTHLWAKDSMPDGVVDVSSKIPNKPTITISQERPYIGEEITIKVKAKPSDITNLTIIAYNVIARYESGSGKVFDDMVNDSKYERTVTFPDSGWVVITATCQDAGCRWSEQVEKKILVLEPGDNRFAMSIPWFFLLLILIWAMISVFLYLVDIPQLEQVHKLIIIAVGFVLIIGLWAGGIIPGALMVKRRKKRPKTCLNLRKPAHKKYYLTAYNLHTRQGAEAHARMLRKRRKKHGLLPGVKVVKVSKKRYAIYERANVTSHRQGKTRFHPSHRHQQKW